jgi:hypothetical protein
MSGPADGYSRFNGEERRIERTKGQLRFVAEG